MQYELHHWTSIVFATRDDPVDETADTYGAKDQRCIVHVGRCDRLIRRKEKKYSGVYQENNRENVDRNPPFTKGPYRWW